MISKHKLKELIKERGLNFRDLAEMLGLSYSTLMCRLKRGYLKSGEMECIIAMFKLNPEEYEPIFFSTLSKHKYPNLQ